ncbi:MAG: hypothetical protein LCH67_00435 [Bacteroidetes bacterium]|nr:hypothetical protein [Bacteroidota bacterium]
MSYTHLYGFTVQGIQAYIFQTNNLREIIGASEIVEAVCTTWFSKFLKDNNISGEAIQMAAGNIRFFTDEKGSKEIFERYGDFVRQKAPGLPFSQAVVKELDLDALEKALSAQRNIPLHDFDLGHMARQMAKTTGDMAVSMESIKNEHYLKKRNAIDKANLAKFKKSPNADESLREKAGITDRKALVNDFEDMAAEGKHSWLALIHIDGNGMGNYIGELITKHKNDPIARSKAIREFAGNISKSTNSAFKKAYEVTFGQSSFDKIPFRPLILGGDDVTLILGAEFAIPFVKEFLSEYETQSLQNTKIKTFTACSGIAFVKAKFPFHYTAELAENLCKAAKEECKRQKSGFVFHKILDSFISNYEELVQRELLLPDEITKISKGFYEINEISELLEKTTELKAEKGIKNAMRQWLDLSMNKSPEADLINERAKKKYGDKFNKYKKEQYADYLTLLAVS